MAEKALNHVGELDTGEADIDWSMMGRERWEVQSRLAELCSVDSTLVHTFEQCYSAFTTGN